MDIVAIIAWAAGLVIAFCALAASYMYWDRKRQARRLARFFEPEILVEDHCIAKAPGKDGEVVETDLTPRIVEKERAKGRKQALAIAMEVVSNVRFRLNPAKHNVALHPLPGDPHSPQLPSLVKKEAFKEMSRHAEFQSLQKRLDEEKETQARTSEAKSEPELEPSIEADRTAVPSERFDV